METKYNPVLYDLLLTEEKNFLKKQLGDALGPEQIKKLNEKHEENNRKNSFNIVTSKLRSTDTKDVLEAMNVLKTEYAYDPDFRTEANYFIAMGYFLLNNYPDCKMYVDFPFKKN